VTAATNRGRHRAERRPITVLDDLASVATGNIAVVGRRAGAVVATSGIAAGMLGIGPATAASSTEVQALPAVDTASLAAGTLTNLAATAPQVTVPADLEWSFDIPKVKVVEQPVVQQQPVRTQAPVSRNVVRPAPKAAENGAKIPQAVSGNAVLEIAARYVGVPYRYGGSTPKGFDCSGFTQYVYAQLGIKLPRTSAAQRYVGTVVSRKDAKPGDLIWTPGHVAIYAGGNMQIDAPRPGKTVQFRKIWHSNPVFIRVTG
jgi:Cell wall-associated hydrolases (invasion-associated proteins)